VASVNGGFPANGKRHSNPYPHPPPESPHDAIYAHALDEGTILTPPAPTLTHSRNRALSNPTWAGQATSAEDIRQMQLTLEAV